MRIKMIPKINFKYSWIYDQNMKEWSKNIKHGPKVYPSWKEINKYIKQIIPLWKKEEKKIIKEMEIFSGLKWQDETIDCYIIGKAIPFSDPLTVPVYKEKSWFVDVLTHELLHRLLTQSHNEKRTKEAWKYLFKKYKNESWNTIIHIPIHAIHSAIYLSLFNKKRLQRETKKMCSLEDYQSSWRIVLQEGHESILKEWRKRLK